MIAVRIPETHAFMASLLTKDTFDGLLVREASLTTFCTWEITGDFHAGYFGEDAADNRERYTPWTMLRPYFYELIKGRHTPSAIRLVFQCPAEKAAALLYKNGLDALRDTLYGLFFNVRFESGSLLLTTGSSQKNFPPSAEIDRLWDQTVLTHLRENGMTPETIT